MRDRVAHAGRVRKLGGLPYAKRRSGCYVHPLGPGEGRMVLLRSGSAEAPSWTANALDAQGRVVWRSEADPDATVAALAAAAWVRGRG